MQLTINITDSTPLTFDITNYTEGLKVDDKYYSNIIESIKSDKRLDSIVKDGLIMFFDKLKKIPFYQNRDDYFISEKHKLEFCILKHEGNYLDDELGITRRHYIDKEVAKEWRNKMQKIFHDDKNFDTERYKKVSSKINKIYERMIGKA